MFDPSQGTEEKHGFATTIEGGMVMQPGFHDELEPDPMRAGLHSHRTKPAQPEGL